MSLNAILEEALLNVDAPKVKQFFESEFIQNSQPEQILKIITEVMESIGKKWEEGRIALSQIYMAGKLMEENLKIHLKNFPMTITDSKFPRKSFQTKIYTCVFEDYHALGQIILNSVLRLAGFQIINLGIGVGEEELYVNVKEKSISVLLISTLMLASAKHLEKTIKKIRKINPQIKIYVGGAPFNFQKDLWQKIGADGYAATPYAIVPILKKLLDEPFQNHSKMELEEEVK